MQKLDKEQIESVVLQMLMARPYKIIEDYKIYFVATEGEKAVVRNMPATVEVESLVELENALNSPEVRNVFIDKFASVTSKGLKTVLARTSLEKDIFCAFEPKD